MSSHMRWLAGPNRSGGRARSGRPQDHEREAGSDQTLLLDAIASLVYAVAAYGARGECHYRRVCGGPPDDAHTSLLGAMEALGHSVVYRASAAAGGQTPELARIGSVAAEISTADGRYALRAIRLGPGLFGAESSVLVIAERVRDNVVDRGRIRERFGLTEREADVAALLADRRSNAEIAQALGISEHTARHHTERVLLKLRARNRHEVQRILSEAVGPSGRAGIPTNDSGRPLT